jgi:hypothetical protein
MSDASVPPSIHPHEMRAEVNIRVGNAIALAASARATPAGLLATGLLVSAVTLSAAVLVWAARHPSR